MKRLLILLLSVLQTSIAWSQTAANDCSASSGYVIAYFNGINNTYVQALQSQITLRNIYGPSYNNERVGYQLFYNPTDGLLKDLAETFSQKQAETPAFKERWDLLWEAINGGTELAAGVIVIEPTLSASIQILRGFVIEKSRDSANSMIAAAAPQKVVSDLATQMQTLFTERKKVVAVGHSQGNLFLNAVYDVVRPGLTTDSIKTVQVAVAANSVRGAYVTVDIDSIIAALRGVLGSTLPVSPVGLSMPLAALSQDYRGHGFSEIYMNSAYPAYQLIKGHIEAALSSVQTPVLSGNSGLFTVTLTWDGPGDIDLHVFEPNQGHVFFASPVGYSGNLDVDNVVADGPEHYVASCLTSRIQEGVYTVAVNNFSKTPGRNATLQLTTLSTVYLPERLALSTAGSSASPTPVFSVRVQRDAGNGTLRVTKE